ncbi:FadR/GntR family transcriptional regulator [Streptomyces olivochromogenes]|uniref:FadR/GntR family transcriptional regulator n=1 Tax=Streptomyces olivochromogenes TaxID=1963 RepID=UPI001F20553D|nr:FCD domain-containing protein [Streptomyces olivochromogenes]MCF3134673.1 FadR family transcriptional regulator [Streptomyces olivochromogenes]
MQSYARRGVHGRTVETLGHRVLSGQIPEGATLNIGALRGELGVSLTALREALKVLVAKGMVDARQRRGTFVRPRTDWNLLDADVLRWQFGDGCGTAADGALLHSLGEVRSIVEPAAARLAAIRRTDTDLEALQTALTAMQEQAGSEHTLMAGQAFHRAVLAATHNELLIRMHPVVAADVAHRAHLAHDAHPLDVNLMSRFRAVLEAVREQDPDAAEHAMRRLLGERAHESGTADAPYA